MVWTCSPTRLFCISLSTRVEQWTIGTGSEPTRIELTDNAERWTGFRFVLEYRGPELAAVRVERTDVAGPLTGQLLQKVPLGALDRAAREHVRGFLEAWDTANPSAALSMFPDPLDWLDDVAGGGTDDHAGDERLARLCQRYLQLQGESDWRETLAQEFHYSRSSVQTIITRARKRRFLTPVARGQQGGQLTPKALRLLAPAQQRSAWDRATVEQQHAALAREALREQITADLLEQFRDGTIDADTFSARRFALVAMLYGQLDPEWDRAAVDAGIDYLKANYEELNQ